MQPQKSFISTLICKACTKACTEACMKVRHISSKYFHDNCIQTIWYSSFVLHLFIICFLFSLKKKCIQKLFIARNDWSNFSNFFYFLDIIIRYISMALFLWKMNSFLVTINKKKTFLVKLYKYCKFYFLLKGEFIV